ncbi:MAG: MmcQ/YjbR family DNA-binding protein [Ghiorsea sp.]
MCQHYAILDIYGKVSPMLYQPPKNFEDYVLSKKGAEKSYPFGENVAVYKVKNKMFGLMGSVGTNLKCDPYEAIIWLSMFDGVTSGYHRTKSTGIVWLLMLMCRKTWYKR